MANRDRVKWPDEILEIERLNCKANTADFQRLVNYVTGELIKKVLSREELQNVTTNREITHFVREAMNKYDPGKHGKLAWYAFQRLRFLVGKWRRQKEAKPRI